MRSCLGVILGTSTLDMCSTAARCQTKRQSKISGAHKVFCSLQLMRGLTLVPWLIKDDCSHLKLRLVVPSRCHLAAECEGRREGYDAAKI